MMMSEMMELDASAATEAAVSRDNMLHDVMAAASETATGHVTDNKTNLKLFIYLGKVRANGVSKSLYVDQTEYLATSSHIQQPSNNRKSTLPPPPPLLRRILPKTVDDSIDETPPNFMARTTRCKTAADSETLKCEMGDGGDQTTHTTKFSSHGPRADASRRARMLGGKGGKVDEADVVDEDAESGVDAGGRLRSKRLRLVVQAPQRHVTTSSRGDGGRKVRFVNVARANIPRTVVGEPAFPSKPSHQKRSVDSVSETTSPSTQVSSIKAGGGCPSLVNSSPESSVAARAALSTTADAAAAFDEHAGAGQAVGWTTVVADGSFHYEVSLRGVGDLEHGQQLEKTDVSVEVDAGKPPPPLYSNPVDRKAFYVRSRRHSNDAPAVCYPLLQPSQVTVSLQSVPANTTQPPTTSPPAATSRRHATQPVNAQMDDRPSPPSASRPVDRQQPPPTRTVRLVEREGFLAAQKTAPLRFSVVPLSAAGKPGKESNNNNNNKVSEAASSGAGDQKKSSPTSVTSRNRSSSHARQPPGQSNVQQQCRPSVITISPSAACHADELPTSMLEALKLQRRGNATQCGQFGQSGGHRSGQSVAVYSRQPVRDACLQSHSILSAVTATAASSTQQSGDDVTGVDSNGQLMMKLVQLL